MINKKIWKAIVIYGMIFSNLCTTAFATNTFDINEKTNLSVTDQNRLLGATPREWESANIREWLNSDKTKVDYTGIAPTYKDEAGFLSDTNFTQSERDAIAITRHSGGFLMTLSGNINDTLYYSQRSLASNSYIYNDKVFILNYTDLINYVECNKQLMNLNKKYYSNYLQTTTNKKDKYSYIVNTGGVNPVYLNWNVMYSSTISTIAGKSQNNIVPALSLKPDYVLSNGIKASNLKVGQTVNFGKYNGESIEWQVINVTDSGYALLWSTKILTVKEYDAQGDVNPTKSNYINFNSYDVDITGDGQNKSWETQEKIVSKPTISILNESVLTTPTNNASITIQIKATDSNNTIKSITLPNGVTVNGDTTSYTITQNGEFDIIAENSQGVISVKHIITKAINTPAEVTITTDKDESTKWTNKPVNVTVSATNNGIYTKTTPAKSTGSSSVSSEKYPTWMPLGGKRIRVKGTLYNKITDADITNYNLDMNATINFRFTYQKYTSNSLSNVYPEFKKITLQELKNAGSIDIDEVFTIPSDVFSGFYIQINIMNGYSEYMGAGYNWGTSSFTYEVLDKDDLKIEEISLPNGEIVESDTATYTIFEKGSYTFSARDNRNKITSKTIELDIDMNNPTVNIDYSKEFTKNYTTLTINANDDLSGIKSIKLPNGEYRTNNSDCLPLSTEYNVTQNGSYTFEICDFAGNKITKTVTIDTIDKDAPTITLTKSSDDWTNYVAITVKAEDSKSGVKRIKLPNGNYVTGDKATYVTYNNGDFEFVAYDNLDNYSSKSINISNIDKTEPTLSYTTTINSDKKSGYINIVASDNESGFKNIKLPDGTIVNGNSYKYPISNNGEYVFYAYDSVSNEGCLSVKISELTGINTSPSNTSKIEYKLSGATTKDWTTYTGAFYITNEGVTTVTSRSYDNAGNIANEKTSIVRIDKSSPINNSVLIKLQ